MRIDRTRGFTLMELLVVVGIIVILISILMPTIGAARASANKTKCAANLRSLGQFMITYANENDGLVLRDYAYDNTYKGGHIFWAEAFAQCYIRKDFPTVSDVTINRDKVLAPELAKIEVYQCPAFPNEAQPVDYVGNAWTSPSGSTQGMLGLSEIKDPSRIIWLSEAHKSAKVDQFDMHDLWKVDHLPTGTAPRIANDNRHRGQVNICFTDGHVESRPWKDITESDFHW